MPISLLNTNPLILLVNPAVKANSVQELIALAKSNPTGLNYSSSGIGGLMYFSAELFKSKTGAKLTHVPYRGGAPATAAVIAGDVQLVFTNMSDAVGQLEGGKVRALGVTTNKRSPSAPSVPTLAEQGIADYHTKSWNGLFAPKGTPQPIVDRHGAGRGGDGEGPDGAEADGEVRLRSPSPIRRRNSRQDAEATIRDVGGGLVKQIGNEVVARAIPPRS